jgi:SAM-dependent methyltransferase
MHSSLNETATSDNFDELGYLSMNPDVAKAVRSGTFASGKSHFEIFGHQEKRQIRLSQSFDALRNAKMNRLRPYLRNDMPFTKVQNCYNYLSKELRALAAIEDTEAVSANGYDGNIIKLIEEYPSGLLLDCGAGKRDVYYDNVVNFEIVDYDTTDVVGVGEELPFLDNTFDAVISVAVLEHVKDPFRCAKEIIRVLKPGGKLYCSVPFLQPYHGYPHHYYNMTHQGLRTLFDHALDINDQQVLESTGPIWTLTWFLDRWANQLPVDAKNEFLSLTVSDLLVSPKSLLNKNWVRSLPKEAQFELASATVLFATKPDLAAKK